MLEIKYSKLCLAVGSSPTLGPFPPSLFASSPNFLHVIRDTSTVSSLRRLLTPPPTKTVAVVGNGGVAMEAVHALSSAGQLGPHASVEWVVRDKFVGHALLDATAAAFLLPNLAKRMVAPEEEGGGGSGTGTGGGPRDPSEAKAKKTNKETTRNAKRRKVEPPEPPPPHTPDVYGSAVGPNWFDKFRGAQGTGATKAADTIKNTMTFTNAKCACHSCGPGVFCMPDTSPAKERTAMREGDGEGSGQGERNLRIRYSSRVGAAVVDGSVSKSSDLSEAEEREMDQLIERLDRGGANGLLLTSGEFVKCDAVIVSCGVEPRAVLDRAVGPDLAIKRGKGGKVVVDKKMETSVEGIYAAGDCCEMEAFERESELFHQMDLWSQGRLQGQFAAHSMLGISDDLMSDFCFEMFGHATYFLNRRVVLLGLYNAQKLTKNPINGFVVTERGLLKEGGRNYERVAREGGGDGDDVELEEEGGGLEEVRPLEGVAVEKKVSELGGEIKILTRVTSEEYTKVVVKGGRIVGAMLVGESATLSDTIEQVMLSRINIDALGFDLLDDAIDIEDYFD
ncbi:hypothetical protein TrRE_jg12566 [Triparma retinervis]|uniref:FAD/NAD(P)-binding domain-containing protein n=1 Tax=Triparma retinervis TaxID=2557542 RepID=A0A9W6Z7R4_9STRA|nr:hypothetical protein TrRE_jg12566 [Triparma retinervis]